MRKTIQIILLLLIFGCGGGGIEGYVNELCGLKRETGKYWSKYDEMNEEFFSIYELSKKEINLVKRVLSMIMSVKSNG